MGDYKDEDCRFNKLRFEVEVRTPVIDDNMNILAGSVVVGQIVIDANSTVTSDVKSNILFI